MAASSGTIGLVQFQTALQGISQILNGQGASSELWGQIQDVYEQGLASPIVRAFLSEDCLPVYSGLPSTSDLQAVIQNLSRTVRLGPIQRDDPIAQNSHHWSRRMAVIQGKRRLTYQALDKNADVIATFLAGSLKDTGQRVAIFFSHNLLQTFEITLGARRAGVSFTNFHSYLSGEDFIRQIQNSPYKILFLDSESLSKIEPALSLLHAQGKIVIDINNHHPETLFYERLFEEIKRPGASTPDVTPVRYPGPTMYSSGTTGTPKLINVKVAVLAGPAANLHFRIHEGDRNLVVGQLYHGAAYSIGKGHLNRGGEVVLTERSGLTLDSKQVMRTIEEQEITNFWISPPWLQGLCLYLDEAPRSFNLNSLRAVFVAASPFLPATKRVAVKRFGPIIWEYYGSMEFGLISILQPGDLLRRPETVGMPAPGVGVEIRDELNRAVSSGQLGRIYVRNERTGNEYKPSDDYGLLDVDGYLTVLGRTVEKIEIDGEVLFPRALENAVMEMPGICDAHVLGVPDEGRTRLVIAAVPKGERKIDEADVIRFLEQRGDVRHYLETSPRVFFLSSIPRAPYKVKVSLLREIICELWLKKRS